MGPKVSVIIPTYYRNDLLRESIESVAAQEYEPVELLVVDDSGEGHAEPVLDEYEAEIDQAIVRKSNGGWNAAYTSGIEASTGKYIQFLDDDDRLFEGKLTKTAKLLRENSEVGVSYCGVLREDEPHRPIPEVRGDILEPAMRFAVFPLWTGSMLMERDVLEECMPLAGMGENDDLEIQLGDTNLIIDLAKRTQFEYVDEILAQYRRNRSRLWTERTMFRKIKQNMEHQQELYGQYPHIKRSVLAEWYEIQGTVHLNEPQWSPRSTLCFAKSAYYSQEDRFRKTALALVSVFGRQGLHQAGRLRDCVSGRSS